MRLVYWESMSRAPERERNLPNSMGLKWQGGKTLTKDRFHFTLDLRQVEAESLDFTIGTEKDINEIK